MKKFEVIYGHSDMPPDYKGYTRRFANDERAVRKLVTKNKPYIKIISVAEINNGTSK